MGGAPAGASPNPNCEQETNPCNSTQMRIRDLYEWTLMLRGEEATINNNAAGGLINALGCITHENQVVTVTISWLGTEETAKQILILRVA